MINTQRFKARPKIKHCDVVWPDYVFLLHAPSLICSEAITERNIRKVACGGHCQASPNLECSTARTCMT
jgi:hypothetical protein